VTVGNFDGVHRGHQALVAAVVDDASTSSGTAVVLTFDPHPSTILSPDRVPATVMSMEQKGEVLAALGVDRLVVLPFTRELSRRPPEEFARLVLRQCLGARTVVVGSNFRFGRDRAGDVTTLQQYGRDLDFAVHGLDPVMHQGAPISSTRIREALARGAVRAAREMLGRRFFVDGTVVRGVGRGRTLGIPTANLAADNQTVPGSGVYACWCHLEGADADPWRGVVNIGRRPTFGASGTTVEAHLLDFSGELYGGRLRLEFVRRLREERAFPGAEALVDQIGRDIEEARRVLEP
jgi:riboflavin kinase/FMN adenylyltransferase